jgi:hypothetical protein
MSPRACVAAVVGIAGLVAVAGGARGEGEDLLPGVAAYFAGSFDRASVALKRSLEAAPPGTTPDPTAAYLLARSFQELGLRGLALHYLALAETSPLWKTLALRELARSYLQVHEYEPVLEVYRRSAAARSDGETAYLAGVAAASLGRWREAEEFLSKIPEADPNEPFARYVRAQARAAREDLTGALSDLEPLARDAEPAELRDQARILRGKLLYLLGRDAEARREFAAVETAGAAGVEALRGLLLSRADAEAASRVRISEKRSEERVSLLAVQAIAAEERGERLRALELRERLRGILNSRLQALESLDESPGPSGTLERDVARFAGLLRHESWRRRWPQERERVEEALGKRVPAEAPAPAAGFEPQDPLFYEAWSRARADPGLRGAADLLSRSFELAEDLRRVPEAPPFWKLWASGEERRLALALAVVRLWNLEALFADHLHTLGAISQEELRERKSGSLERAARHLRRLYVGARAELPSALSNLAVHLEYKESDMTRLLAALPERATDPVTSLLGNLIDLLEQARAGLAAEGRPVPDDGQVGEELASELAEENRRLGGEIEARIHEVVAPTLRGQLAFLTRLAADNERALSRLYGAGLAGEGSER